jgi:hypothetical protein
MMPPLESSNKPFSSYTIKPGEIKIENLQEWRGIKPDEVGIADWFRDKNLPPADVEKFLRESYILDIVEFENNAPIKFTFKSAAQVVAYVINRNAKLDKKNDFIPIFCPNMGGELLRGLTNINVERSDLMPKPPHYGGNICSADSRDLSTWLGAILQMFYEQKHISGYGRKDAEYWVTL